VTRNGGAGWRQWLAVTTTLALVLGIAALGERSAATTTTTAAAAPVGDPLAADQPAGVGPAPTLVATGAHAAGAAGIAPTAGSGATAPGKAGADQAGGATPPPGAVYDPGVTNSSILIGGSTFTSGPAAVYGDQIAVGFEAGVDYINEHGGVNGRRLDLKVYDDGGDPTQQLENTKRLVEVDHVFALSMVYTPDVGQYVDSVGIPVMQEGQFDTDFTDPWWFPIGGPQSSGALDLANYGAETLGAKSVAIFYLDAGAANYSKAFADEVAADWEAYGVKVPVEEAFTPDQTSCSDALQAASSAKVDYIDFEVSASQVINCGVDAQLQDYKPPKGWGGYLIGVPAVWQALGDESLGMYAVDAFGALYNVPAYQQAVAAVSSSTDADSSVTAANFVAALALGDALAKLGNDITRVRLRDELDTFTDWQPGLTADPDQPSWTWTPQCHIALHGGYVIEVEQQAGSLAWTQVTPQQTATPLPPGVGIPPLFSTCTSAFRRT